MMKLLFKFLKKLPAKWLVGVIAIVWVVGVGLGRLNVTQCIIITAVIVGLWAIYYLITWLRSRGRGEGEEKPPELEEIEERLVNAVRAGKDVPWYLLIGPKGCGKTFLLRNSGLDFSYIDTAQEKPIAQGIDETSNCDFFHTKEGIILDTAGRYVTYGKEAQEQTEWQGLLSLLRKRRSRKTIAGLLIAVDVAELLKGDDYAISEAAKSIKDRMGEAISQLGMTFPVYLLFTKCDQIYGFSEFFSGLSKSDQPQIWGATLRTDQQANPGAAFDEECKQLLHSLTGQRKGKLASGNPEDGGAIYAFPLEFEAAQQKLGRFVAELFPAVAKEKPIFRGFYFTSATQQDGTPIDFVLRRVAESGEKPFLIESQTSGESKSFFIRDIFTRVVFPDRGLDKPTAEEGRRRTIRRLTFCGIAAGVIAIMLLILGLTYSSNKRHMKETEKAAISVNEARNYTDEVEKLERFERLRKSIIWLEKFPLFSFPWHGQRSAVADAARRFYLTQKYGSSDGWRVELSRKVEIPVRMFKSEADVLEPVAKAEIRAVVSGKEHKFTTDKEGRATFKTKVKDGKVNVVFSTSHEEEGFEPQPDQTYQIQPGEKVSPDGIRFVFSKLGRVITVHCIDQNGEDLAGVPVSVIKQADEQEEYESRTNEQGIAQLRLEAPKDTVLLVYYGDSPKNYPVDKPDSLTIKSGQSRYSLEKQLRRKMGISVIALSKNADETIQQAKSGVSISVGGTKLGLTDNNGHWTGASGTVPTRQNVVASPKPDSITVETTASGYDIKLEYILPEPKEPVQPVVQPVEPEPMTVINLDSSVPADVEVWMYISPEDDDMLNSSVENERMEFRSDGQQIRLLRLDAKKAADDGGLELPREAENHDLQLYHPDYWPKKVSWSETKRPLGMIELDQERSLEDFGKKQRDGAEFYYEHAQRYHSEGNHRQAISDYTNALRLAPRLKYFLQLAWAYYENDQPERALKQVKRGLKLKLTDDPEADEQLLRQQLQELLNMLE